MNWCQSASAHRALLVIIHDLDVKGVPIPPSKADAPLVVDADTVLTSAIGRQFLETIAGRDPEILERGRRIELDQFAERHAQQAWRQPAHRLPPEQALSVLAREAPDHAS